MADKNPFDDPKFGAPPAAANPFDNPEFGKSSSAMRRFVADPAISAAKGVIGVGEGAIGLADIVSGGRAGKALESVGVEPKRAKEVLSEYLTPEQQAANRAVQQADGFVPTLKAAVENPSVIAHSLVESAPSIFAGGAVARGARALAPGMKAVTAGALGEGTVGAGLSAEQIRQETKDGLLTPEQAALAAGSGAATALITRASGGIANKLGIGDVETALAGGAARASGKGMPRRIGEGIITEGLLEEMPQSAQEQIAQNLALGKPWDEGVGSAAAMGALTGGVLGGGFQLFARQDQPAAPPPEPPPPMLALPAPGQTSMQMGGEPNRTPEQIQAEIEAVRNWTEVNAARRAEEERLAGLRTQEQPIAGLLPAPGQSTADRQIPPDVGPIQTAQGYARQGAADNAAAIYAARAEEDERLARLAAQGPISRAAATAIGTGLSQEASARRQGEVDEALAPKESPLALPAPAGEKEKQGQLKLDQYLSQVGAYSLMEAQLARTAVPDKYTVVPHLKGGFTLAPTELLTEQQLKSVAGIQQPGGTLPSPKSPSGEILVDSQGVARQGTQEERPTGMRQAYGEWRRDMGTPARVMPIATVEAAKRQADSRTASTGVEHEVVPHPTKRDAFAVQPVHGAGAFTGREQTSAVNDTQGRMPDGNTLERMPAEANASGPLGAQATQPPAPSAEGQPDIAAAANEAATSPLNDLPHPTTAQAAAGNYKKGHVKVHGLDVTVENPDGSVRVAKDGSWASGTKGHYGYIRRSKGADGDQVDVNVGPAPDSPTVFVVNQVDPKTGKFDEHKVMLGYGTAAEAEAAYRANYPSDWKGLGSIQETDVAGLKAWLKEGNTSQPFGETMEGAAKPAPKLGKADLEGVVVRQAVQVEETGETVYVERDAKEALVEARSRVRKFEALAKCLSR